MLGTYINHYGNKTNLYVIKIRKERERQWKLKRIELQLHSQFILAILQKLTQLNI